ncbi:TraX family protein [Flavonifractor plautii]|nr:TraX family protein [Flavonifractor plautii]
MGCPGSSGGWPFPFSPTSWPRGCRRTRFFHRYLIRLGACALLSQAPFTLATGVWGGSVLLTFFLSAGAIYGYERLSKAEHGPAVSAIPPVRGLCAGTPAQRGLRLPRRAPDLRPLPLR